MNRLIRIAECFQQNIAERVMQPFNLFSGKKLSQIIIIYRIAFVIKQISQMDAELL